MLRVGIQSDTWYSDLDPDGSIAFCKSCGFTGVDFDLNRYMKARDMYKAEGDGPYTSFYDQSEEALCEYFAPLKAACEKHDVEVSQIHAPFPS